MPACSFPSPQSPSVSLASSMVLLPCEHFFLLPSTCNSSTYYEFMVGFLEGFTLVLKNGIIEWFIILGNLPEDDEKQRC
jgi:hypothetical protein